MYRIFLKYIGGLQFFINNTYRSNTTDVSSNIPLLQSAVLYIFKKAIQWLHANDILFNKLAWQIDASCWKIYGQVYMTVF